MQDTLTSWNTEISQALKENGESWDDVIASTLSYKERNRTFDPTFGSIEGTPFTLWTRTRVYFPGVYDGAEWVASVPRHPVDEASKHVGGG